jgi:hypothetical protein
MGRLERVAPVLNPMLFATFPLLSLFAHNQSEIELGVVWVPLALSVAAGAGLYGVSLLVVKHSMKAGALASLIVLAFSYYGIFSDKISAEGTGAWFGALWAALFALAVYALVRTRRALTNLTLVLTVGAAVLVVGPVANIAIYQANHPSLAAADPHLWPTSLPKPAPAGAARPDIYVIVPDDYARSDVLKQYFHYDDAGFIRQLEQRGFVVSGQARSPYSDSEMNIAAMLNMDYLSRLPSVLGKRSQDVRPVRRLIADNRASRLLKSLGYRYVHLDTDEVTFPAGNPGISPLATPDSFMNLWLHQSVLRLVGGTLGFDDAARNERFRGSIRSTFSKLAALPGARGPKFVVFHTLLPHDPYIFGARGERVTFPAHSDQALGSKLGMTYYVQQLRFLSSKLLEAVDAILAKSKSPPVIVIQSDEGFQGDPDTLGEAAMRDVRVKGLIALYLPGAGRPRVPEPPNTVNSLRFVFNRYFGTHYEPLRSASYPELDLPYQFEEMRVR